MRPTPPADSLLLDPSFPALKEYLIGVTGLAYYAERDNDLARRVADRLGALGLGDCASYLALLREPRRGPRELDALIEDLTIGETFFFRHREMFEALRDVVLPDVIARKSQQRQLHIWSAGCSIGAEPYSISILLERELAGQLEGWETGIVGTDINRAFLARARAGLFEEWALRGAPADVRAECFLPAGNGYLLAPRYRAGVTFQYHNLVAHPFPSLLNNLSGFDVILCRNVTIYFSLPIVRRLIEQFHQSLVPGGWLLVGHAEPNLDLFRAFRTVNAAGAVLYQKAEPEPAAPPPAAPVNPWRPPTVSPPFQAEAVAEPPPAPPAAPDVEAIRRAANRGEWQRAADLCRQGLARDTLNPIIYFYQALVLEQTGRHAEAEQALRRVLYLDRNSVLGHYYLGLLLQRRGELRQAGRSFRNALELLAGIDPGRVFAEGDGIAADDLTKLTRTHLEVLEGHER